MVIPSFTLSKSFNFAIPLGKKDGKLCLRI